jgi:hypothetical protein
MWRSTTWMRSRSARRASRLRRHPGRRRARSGRQGRPRRRRRDRRTAQGQRRYAKRPTPTPLPPTEIGSRPACASVTTNRSQTRQSRRPNVAPTGDVVLDTTGGGKTPRAAHHAVLTGARASRDVARAENKGWSLYGPQRAQPVATGGKSQRHETAEASPKTVAVGCDRLREEAHGKEGSTVRVRQRALQKAPESGAFRWSSTCSASRLLRYGKAYGKPDKREPRTRDSHTSQQLPCGDHAAISLRAFARPVEASARVAARVSS